MEKNIDVFLEEITDNFSKLFVETFIMRYLVDYDKKYLLHSIELAKDKLDYKINKYFKQKIINKDNNS